MKTFLILRDLEVEGAEGFAGLISGVDIEAAFAQRPPSNWAAVWLSGEWLQLREGLSPLSMELYLPHDNPWHTGLAMTSANLSGENFWGGPTFVRDTGYAWLENQGRIRHQAWN